MKKKIFSIKISDCEVQHFRAGGNGGQNQNKRDSAARVIHRPSGAVGESREQKSQIQNKKAAFLRMAQSQKFQLWCKQQALDLPPLDNIVDEIMKEEHLKIEYFKPK